MPSERRVGLARALSKLGYTSRSKAEELIRGGRVMLNGHPSRNPELPVRLGRDRIEVDERPLIAASKSYIMLNKPRGLVTTRHDEQGRDTVYSCLPEGVGWISPVGRLDKASEGMLLFTNDSEWGARITDPETRLEKLYHVQTASLPTEKLLGSLKRGVASKDGEVLHAKDVRVLRVGERNSWLEITLDEGKNRQIRRMLESQGIEVLSLVRVAIGPLKLGNLAHGKSRPLTPAEKSRLDRAIASGAGGVDYKTKG